MTERKDIWVKVFKLGDPEADMPPRGRNHDERLRMVRELSAMGYRCELSPDFRDIVAAFLDEDVQFLLVGAHALAIHGVPRATGDLDLFVARTDENATRVWRALVKFGAPLEALKIERGDLLKSHAVFQIGQPPNRIDVMTGISGVEFDEAWAQRVVGNFEGREVGFLSREHLIKNKSSTGRNKDRGDLDMLGPPLED
ncbi:MAG: hypothetical protein KF689_08570 [Gemmatimonadaceae bacterium]|nr:hypothetical protein [Gemmatimonadaceae bacterium]MCW5827349.1 hypothetical protein [Gemmatimonadaceae bacterium]